MTKQEHEKAVVECFFAAMKVPICKIQSSDKPDVIVTTSENSRRHIGVELRVHYNDESVHRGSHGQRLLNFWADVQRHVETLKKRHPSLSEIHAYVTLDKHKLSKRSLGSLAQRLAQRFAHELVTFVSQESQTASSDIIIIPDWNERECNQFVGHPLLEEYVREVTIRKDLYARWDANVNPSFVGVNTKTLAEIIKEKNTKARNYNRASLNELWLLIAAPHDSTFNSMHNHPEQVKFHVPEITQACEGTPFDKIFFWSSPPHEWHRQIWPVTG